MTSPSPKLRARPMSPHLQVYRPQLTSGLSIFHRITGVALWFSLPVFSIWLLALAKSPDTYMMVLALFQTVIGQVMLAGWTFCLFYHVANGIRYLIMGASPSKMTIPFAYTSGYIALFFALSATTLLWLKAYDLI